MMPSEQVRIERIATGGDGVGRLADGRAVFVPRTAPGDLVELERIERRKRFARGTLARTVEAAPHRVDPPCRHYVHQRCGGCQLQHLNAEAQRRARATIVGDALRRLARLDVPDPPLEPAPSDWAYRTRLTLHRDGPRLGLRPLGEPARAFELERCPIAHDALMQLWARVRQHRALLPAGLEHLELRRAARGALHLTAIVATGDWPAAAELAGVLAQEHVAVTLWLREGRSAPRWVAGVVADQAALAFGQVHPVMGDRARRHALGLLGARPGDAAWDLYAGIGQAAAELEAAGAAVTSVEADVAAVAARVSGAGTRALAARVEDVIELLPQPDIVFANPPRAGLEAAVAARLASRAPRRIAYMSCDPATLARDIVRLGGRYRLAHARAFDLFPQTAHVETVALLERQ